MAYEPLHYPPLAGQTRITGTVKLHVVIEKTGAVGEVSILSGHPLLSGAAQSSVRSWKFETIATGPADFELTYEFELRDKASEHADEEITFDTPNHVRIVSNPPIIYTNYAQPTGRPGD